MTPAVGQRVGGAVPPTACNRPPNPLELRLVCHCGIPSSARCPWRVVRRAHMRERQIRMSVYVPATGAFLPGPPIDNEAMEARGGLIGGEPPRYRKMVLRKNGIETRHYAID